MDPVIGAGLITAGANVLGGLFNAGSQMSANQTNIKLARENRAWQEYMWNKQNEYNTPAAQIERMKEAGLNPALMYSQGNVGNADQPHGISSPQVQPVTGFGDAISTGGDAIASSMIQLEQIKQMRAQTKLLQAKAVKEANTTMSPEQYAQQLQLKFAELGAKPGYYKALTAYSDSRAAGQDIYNFYAPKFMYNQARQGELTNNQIAQNMIMQVVDTQLKVLMTHSRIKLNNAMIANIGWAMRLAEQKYNFLDVLNPQQVQNLIQDTALKAAQTSAIPWQQGRADREQILKYTFRAIEDMIGIKENMDENFMKMLPFIGL